MKRIPHNEFTNDLEAMRDMHTLTPVKKNEISEVREGVKAVTIKDWKCLNGHWNTNLSRRCKVCK